MRISDWSSDVCSSDLEEGFAALRRSVQDRWLDDLVVTVTTLSTVVQHADRIADRLAQPAPVSWSEPLDDVTRQLTRLVFGGMVVGIEIGRAQVSTPVPSPPLVCRPLLVQTQQS